MIVGSTPSLRLTAGADHHPLAFRSRSYARSASISGLACVCGGVAVSISGLACVCGGVATSISGQTCVCGGVATSISGQTCVCGGVATSISGQTCVCGGVVRTEFQLVRARTEECRQNRAAVISGGIGGVIGDVIGGAIGGVNDWYCDWWSNRRFDQIINREMGERQ